MNRYCEILFLSFIIHLMLFVANCVNYEFTHNNDVWKEIIRIADGCFYNSELASLSLTDKSRKRLVEPLLQKRIFYLAQIRSVIQELQYSENAIMDNYKTFKNTSSEKLVKQYLYGFNGELQCILAVSGGLFANFKDSERLSLQNKILRLNKLLRKYKSNYGPLPPAYQCVKTNISDHELATFEQFSELQRGMEQLVSIINQNVGHNYHAIMCISKLKIVMQCIGIQIGYPEMIKLDNSNVDFKLYIHQIKLTFIHYKLRMMSGADVNQDQLHIIMKSVPNSNEFADCIIQLLSNLQSIYMIF